MPDRGKIVGRKRKSGMCEGATGDAHTPKRKKREMTCAERLGREVLHTSKRKKQEMACAEPPPPSRSRHTVHVKKGKVRNGVCGAPPAIPKSPHSTRQKEKSRKWRVRSGWEGRCCTRQKGKSKE